MDRIDPFRRNNGPPKICELKRCSYDDNHEHVYLISGEIIDWNIPRIETRTGWVFLTSASGKIMETVRTEPKLVPTHNVGSKDIGSAQKLLLYVSIHIDFVRIHKIIIHCMYEPLFFV